jgi:hypothetical protein
VEVVLNLIYLYLVVEVPNQEVLVEAVVVDQDVLVLLAELQVQ